MNNNVNLFFKILIVFALFFYSCKNETKKVIKYNNVSVELEKYQSPEYGISIQYPVEWENIGGNQDVIFAVKMVKDSLDKSVQNAIHITKLTESNDPSAVLGDVVKASINDMTSSFEKFQMVASEEFIINNLPTVKIKCNFFAGNESVTTLLYFVKTPKSIYLIGLSSPSAKFPQYEEIYEYIAKTFNTIE